MQTSAPPAPPPAPMPTGNQNPYDFIMNAGKKPRRSFGGGSTTQRIIIVAIGGLLFITAVIVFFSIIGNSGKSSTDNLIALTEQQNEIARVAAIGVDKATSDDLKNLAITTQVSVTSSQKDTLLLLQKSGHKVNDKTLALLQNSQTDTRLNAASDAGTFDSTFKQVLSEELSSYRLKLQTYFKASTSDTEKQVLQDSFNTASILSGPQS